jgi:hypothetical protein
VCRLPGIQAGHQGSFNLSKGRMLKANQLAKATGQIDPFQASMGSLLVVAFPKTNSKNYPFAIQIVESAERWAIVEINGQPMHVAAFGKTQVEGGRAATLLGYSLGWKGTLLFVKGRLLRDSYRVREVIECFVQSCECTDIKAHCHEVMNDPKYSPYDYSSGRRKIDRYIFPCKHLMPWMRFDSEHPSSYQDQIQAAGVKHACTVCPNFRPQDFVKIEKPLKSANI